MGDDPNETAGRLDHDHARELAFASLAGRPRERRNLRWAIALTGGFMVVEAAAGILSGSLALLADAGHMFVDFASLAGSYLAVWFGQRPPSHRHTFGFYRTEILAALANGVTLILITLYILFEAVQRFQTPREVNVAGMLGIAALGLFVNLVALRILRGGRSLNLRSALLHVRGDLLSSVGIVVGGVVILATGWTVVDPLLSLGIALLILVSAYRVTTEAVNILLEATPREIDLKRLEKAVHELEGVRSLHDVHLWTVTSGLYSMSAHLLIEDQLVSRGNEVVMAVERLLRERFGIAHTTLQVEAGRHDETIFLCCLDLDAASADLDPA